jgi:cysteine synthase A
MNIFINGKKELLQGGLTIAAVLSERRIRQEVVTVELNDNIIDRKSYDLTALKDRDRIELVFFMGGGSYTSRIAKDALELIGNTPLVRLNRLVTKEMAEVLAKVESYNPGGSVKDRICLNMIEDAEKRGLIKEDSTIIEPTSGNTGIGLSVVCAVKGYKLILTMPETMSLERIYIMRFYGAKIVLTPGLEGMAGAIKKAEELLKKTHNSFMPQQFRNPANPQIHRMTTAKEILDATEGRIDAFVAGVGTGGTITGVGEVLKKLNSNIKIIAIEPASSPVLSGGKPGPHKIQGIGAGFVPEVLNRSIIDKIYTVKDNDAFHTSKLLARKEGLFVGISAGAACFVAIEVAKELGKNKRVVTVFPDTGERYFSMEQYFEG